LTLLGKIGSICAFNQEQQTNQNQMRKIAIYVEGGIIQAIRSNIGEDLEVEIVDADNIESCGEEWKAEDRWEEIQNELEFGNY
jgi:hypothetical protein